MVNQYPDTITVTVSSAPTQNESTGVWVPGASTTHIIKCRAEINGGGGKMVGADGSVYDYSFTVYMPRMTTTIPQDSTYVLQSDNTTYRGTVKGFSNGQLNSRLWL